MSSKIKFFRVYFKKNLIGFYQSPTGKESGLLEFTKDTTDWEIGQMIDFVREKKTNLFVKTNLKKKEIIEKITSAIGIRKASGGIVENRKGKFLGILRKGNWDFPKGHIERKEKKKETAIREISEETGLKKSGMRVKKRIHNSYYILTNQYDTWLKEVTWYHLKCDNDKGLAPQYEEEITKTKWLTQKEVLEKYGDSYPSIKDLVLEFFR